jgi:hypothetical protein
LVIRVEGAAEAGLSIKVDGSPLASQLIGEASPLNPGHHQVVGDWAEKHVTVEVTLAVREQKQITLKFDGQETPGSTTAPAHAGAPPSVAGTARVASESSPADVTANEAPSRRTLAWAALGSGGAALALGAVTGVLAMSKRSELDKNPSCADDHVCPRQLSSSVDGLNTLRTVSTVGFIAGGVLAGAGVVLLLTAPKATEAPRAALFVSPTSLGLAGQF